MREEEEAALNERASSSDNNYNNPNHVQKKVKIQEDIALPPPEENSDLNANPDEFEEIDDEILDQYN